MHMFYFVIILFLATFGDARPRSGNESGKPRKTTNQPTCGYETCPAVKDDMLNVHLVPHTHDDVGWLKTVDQYFYGDRNDIQNAGVQYILDSVIQELIKDPSKRFIYVEIAFFYRWWMEQNEDVQQQVKQLVNEGRLEFILGGWCMNDEASTHYNAIIDQHTLGFTFLEKNFGECARPRVAWQVDPFGHSREQASLFAQMGFDGLFFGRLDYQDKNLRLNTSNMEIVWRGSPNNLGRKADLFTGVLYNGYGPPPDFCSECNSEPIMDDKRLHDYNVDKKVQEFIKAAQDQAKHYRSNNIMMTMGGDFRYQNADMWFKNMDKIIKYVNQQQSNGSNVNVLYSTPSCYLYNVNHLNQIWNSKDDDFFPYSDRAHDYWTGYFTSRASLKEYVKKTNKFLQVCKHMNIYTGAEHYEDDVNKLAMAMGVLQHHDAVSGTEKQQVAYDYAMRLSEGIHACERVINAGFGNLMPRNKTAGTPVPLQHFCGLTNISRCNVTEHSKQFVVTVYNPIGRDVDSWIRIPVSGSAYHVEDADGNTVPSQLMALSQRTIDIPERNRSIAKADMIFKVSVPRLGFRSYIIQDSNDVHDMLPQETKITKMSDQENPTLSNKYLSVEFDGSTGRVMKLTNIERNITTNLEHEFAYYLSAVGDNRHDNTQASGAYTFRPNGTTPITFDKSNLASKTYIKQGQLVNEIEQTYSPWATQVVRVYEDERYVEFEWTIGPINITDGIGKEVISKFKTNLNNRGAFYTDANGREIMERRRDYRKTWRLNQTEPVAGNYYPINSRIYIQDHDKNTQFTILTDRSQGGSSLQDGNIEIMIHRRILHDDSKGVSEALNETGSDGKGLIIRGKHYIFFDTILNSTQLHRDFALKEYMSPSVSFAELAMSREDWQSKFNTQVTLLRKSLPLGVHMLTFESIPGPREEPMQYRYLVRFEHIYETHEAITILGALNINVTFNLRETLFEIDDIKELTLGANLELSQLNRLPWTYIPDNSGEVKTTPVKQTVRSKKDPMDITLSPMEIRTFLITTRI